MSGRRTGSGASVLSRNEWQSISLPADLGEGNCPKCQSAGAVVAAG
ncbi:hypothetical protein XFF4834R_chr32920 [Xanthomonas citri pv. fuscans]|nr:hypothetical protein XFF4834R_chr32920 [Xanthomonas citri pv. fuscans]